MYEFVAVSKVRTSTLNFIKISPPVNVQCGTDNKTDIDFGLHIVSDANAHYITRT